MMANYSNNIYLFIYSIIYSFIYWYKKCTIFELF